MLQVKKPCVGYYGVYDQHGGITTDFGTFDIVPSDDGGSTAVAVLAACQGNHFSIGSSSGE